MIAAPVLLPVCLVGKLLVKQARCRFAKEAKADDEQQDDGTGDRGNSHPSIIGGAER